MHRAGLIAVTLAAMALLFAAGYWQGFRSTLKQIAERGDAALVLVTERLTLQLERHRYLPAVLANDPIVQEVLRNAPKVQSANQFLQRIADTSGALDIFVTDQAGTALAASNWDLPRSYIGRSFASEPYFQRAITGGLAFYHAVDANTGGRAFYFAHPILSPERDIRGLITVKVDLERIESQWRGDRENLFFSDQNGVIFLSNRPSLTLRTLNETPVETTSQYANQVLVPLPSFTRRPVGAYQFWSDLGLEDFPQDALFLTSKVQTLNMDANILIETRPAHTQGLLFGGLAATLGGVAALLAAILMQRRAALSAQLSIEERAREELEEKVAKRTEALRKVQGELVQAGKLTALGEMSAGISHELNQPLAAIQTLSDNSQIFLERGDDETLSRNLSKISQVAERMARIIKNLRAFARKEDEEITDVDLVEVIRDALSLTSNKLTKEGIQTSWSANGPLHVRGGRVRLQQVVVNLISNAADAMQDAEIKEIEIATKPSKDRIILTIRDFGPGLKDPEKIFDPFYTTKTVGEGLGLGLSITYGIVQSFGAHISGENHPRQGAVFTVDLERTSKAKA